MSNTARTGTSEESLKILVVDDEPAMVGALGALLGQAGHRIVAAYDGEEALRRFHEDEPDLVLLDLAMPGLDGATVCQRIRETSDVPIVVVSGERDRAAELRIRLRRAVSVANHHQHHRGHDGGRVDQSPVHFRAAR